MTTLEGMMSEPASLPRSILRSVLFLMSIVFLIFGVSAVLHQSAITLQDLTVLLPSLILMLAPYLVGLIEGAWNLSLFSSAIIAVALTCLCTALFFLGLDSFDESSTDLGRLDTRSTLFGTRATP